jgi:hypothetical protein
MNSVEIKEIVEAAVKNSRGLRIWQIVILVVISGLSAFMGSYLQETARSSVIKKDVEEITRIVENVKRSVDAIRSAETTKYQLKYNACLEALRLIDAHFSHTLRDPGGAEPSEQYATTESARACHNNLILSCEDPKLIELFSAIIFGPKSGEQQKPPTDLLNDFRNLVRKELGFGTNLELDRDRAWFGKVGFDKDR